MNYHGRERKTKSWENKSLPYQRESPKQCHGGKARQDKWKEWFSRRNTSGHSELYYLDIIKYSLKISPRKYIPRRRINFIMDRIISIELDGTLFLDRTPPPVITFDNSYGKSYRILPISVAQLTQIIERLVGKSVVVGHLSSTVGELLEYNIKSRKFIVRIGRKTREASYIELIKKKS